MRSAWYPQWRSVVVKLLYRDEWVLKVWGSCALSMLSWIHTRLCDVIQTLETVDATLPSFPALLGIFSAWQWSYSFSQGENPSVDMYLTQSYLSWAAVGDSVETSWAKLIQGGRPRGVKQSRCENVSWTCTLCTIIYTGWVEIAINDFFLNQCNYKLEKSCKLKCVNPKERYWDDGI